MRKISVLATAAAVALAAVVAQGQAPAGERGLLSRPGSGLLMGRVIEATSTAPVPGAIVELGLPGSNERLIVATDSAGQFVMGALPAGTFYLSARKGGYSETGFGQRRPHDYGGHTVTLAEAERRGDITLRLWKYGAITGRVVDELGDPVINASVRAFERTWVAGRPVLSQNADQAMTDDRGVYRISRIVAGDYVVAIVRQMGSTPASLVDEIERLRDSGDKKAFIALSEPLWNAEVPTIRPGEANALRVGSSVIQLVPPFIPTSNGTLFVYPTQYFAAATSVSSARTLAVAPGQDVTGIDFTMRPVRTVSVNGSAADANGPVAHFPLRLVPAGATDFEMERFGPGATTVTDAAGHFTFPAVEPGQYVVQALKGPGGEVGFAEAAGVETSAGGGMVLSTGGSFMGFSEEGANPSARKRQPTLHGSVSVSVADRAVDNVTIAIRNGVRVTGRVEFNGTGQPPAGKALEQIRLVMDVVDGRTPDWSFDPSGTFTSDGRFETVELPPGRYFVRVPHPPAGWFLESVRLGDRDLSDTAIEVGDVAPAPLTVRFTDKTTVISGTVRTANGDPIGDTALVVAFPVDRTRWKDYGSMPRRLASVGAARDGAFELRGLPVGEYFVAAIRDDFLSDWRSPDMLAAIMRTAERLNISAGDKRTLALTVGSIR